MTMFDSIGRLNMWKQTRKLPPASPVLMSTCDLKNGGNQGKTAAWNFHGVRKRFSIRFWWIKPLTEIYLTESDLDKGVRRWKMNKTSDVRRFYIFMWIFIIIFTTPKLLQHLRHGLCPDHQHLGFSDSVSCVLGLQNFSSNVFLIRRAHCDHRRVVPILGLNSKDCFLLSTYLRFLDYLTFSESSDQLENFQQFSGMISIILKRGITASRDYSSSGPIIIIIIFFLAILEYWMSIGLVVSYSDGAWNIIKAVPNTQLRLKIHRKSRSRTIATYFQSSSIYEQRNNS